MNSFVSIVRHLSLNAYIHSANKLLVPKPAHTSVLLTQAVESLKPTSKKVYLDMTFGAGGHTEACLKACPDIFVIGLDRDPSVMQYAEQVTHKYGSDHFLFLNGRFTQLISLLGANGFPTENFVDGILLDVGASSMQFDDRTRGFGIRQKSPLDMRMNKEDPVKAADVVNRLEQKDLQRIIKRYGEEKKARQIAEHIVEYRQMMGSIKTNRELQDIVKHVYNEDSVEEPMDKIGRKRHPATLTFQALRIFVNDELNELYNGLKVAHKLLKPDGVCAAITFHSLEHNIVHQSFNAEAVKVKEKLVTKDLENNYCKWKPQGQFIKPSEDEISKNPRARSAQLRVARKLVKQYV